MKLLLSLAVVVASVSAAPRYLVIPIEDVDLSNLAGQSIPVYRMPGLARQARQLEEEDSFQRGPRPTFDVMTPRADSQGSGSNAYGAPPATGPDHVDYGAYGWYTDHPVLLGPGAHY